MSLLIWGQILDEAYPFFLVLILADENQISTKQEYLQI